MPEAVTVAANLAVLGIDPIEFLDTRDSFRRNLFIAIAREAAGLQEIQQKNQAIMIAEQVGKLFG